VQRWSDGTYTDSQVSGGSGGGSPAVMPPTATPGFDWPGLWGGTVESNQQRFDWDKQRTQQQLYADLAQALLAGATQLRGPENWLKYAQYTQGGQDVFNRLFGSAAAPSFSAPTGFSNPVTINSVLADLGLAGAGGAAGAGGTYVRSDNGDVLTIDRMRADLKAAGWPDADGATPEQVLAKYQEVSGVTVTPSGGGGVGAQNAAGQSSPMATAMQQATAPVTGTGDTAGQAGQVPLPHQINPAVWDSLSNTAKQMILASAEEGNTPSGAWDATDFMAQLNAARPQGAAPRRTTFNWGSPQTLY
jgi:hypothetical protein